MDNFSVMSCRSSRSQMFLKIDVLKNFASFTSFASLPVLESLFNKVAGEVFKNTFFYRTPPVTASVVFAAKQLNILCYNDNLKLSWKYGNYHHLPDKVMIISISYQE